MIPHKLAHLFTSLFLDQAMVAVMRILYAANEEEMKQIAGSFKEDDLTPDNKSRFSPRLPGSAQRTPITEMLQSPSPEASPSVANIKPGKGFPHFL